MSHETSFNAGAEAFQTAEGTMSGAAMRGTAALPGSETSSRTKGSRRNLGDLLVAHGRYGGLGPGREAQQSEATAEGRRGRTAA